MKRQKEVDYMPILTKCAYVNRSGTTITVYKTAVNDVGSGIVGYIKPSDFYIVPNSSSGYPVSHGVWIHGSGGSIIKGVIVTSPGGYEADWVRYQEPYHYYNSNGSALSTAAKETINGTRYTIFTVAKAARTYRKSSGSLMSDTLPIGTKLAVNSQTTIGQSYPEYMLFNKKKLPGGSWQNLIPNESYGFVDLGLRVGCTPSERPIR